MYGQSEQANGHAENNTALASHVNSTVNHNGTSEMSAPKHGIMEKLSSKLSKTSETVTYPKDEVVKFKLVEDIRLVTIPITTCLLVLLSYIVFGSVLFASWEVAKSSSRETVNFDYFPGLVLFRRCIFLLH